MSTKAETVKVFFCGGKEKNHTGDVDKGDANKCGRIAYMFGHDAAKQYA